MRRAQPHEYRQADGIRRAAPSQPAGHRLADVDAQAAWQLAALPRGVSPADLSRIIDSCDRRSVAGRRDYAVILLLARLSLRAGGGRRPGPGRHRLAAGRDHRPRQGQSPRRALS